MSQSISKKKFSDSFVKKEILHLRSFSYIEKNKMRELK